jgi:hypothetical protein
MPPDRVKAVAVVVQVPQVAMSLVALEFLLRLVVEEATVCSLAFLELPLTMPVVVAVAGKVEITTLVAQEAAAHLVPMDLLIQVVAAQAVTQELADRV